METRDASSEPAPEDGAEATLRRRILTAAFNAFVERGYGGASTLEIATRAKVSKREIYSVFGNKQAMLRACIAWRTRHMLPSGPPPPACDRAALARTLTTFGERLLTELSHPDAIAVHRLAVTEANHSPEVGQEIEAVRAAGRAALTMLLKQAQDAGLLDRADPEEMAVQFLSLLWGDLLVRMLQRLAGPPAKAEAHNKANAAAEALLALHPGVATPAQPPP